jgi:alcohol dehydrogenase class IV
MEIGKNACDKLPGILQSLGVNKALIVTDKMMVQLGYIQKIKDILGPHGISCEVYDDTIPEPTDSSIMNGVKMLQEGDYDGIIALGGGSPIDSAKAIGILGKFGGVIRDYKFPRIVNEESLPIIAIPTTAGTGSEATRFTIITDESSNEKLLCVGIAFMPVATVIDYNLTLTVPPRTTADTGIDAMCHAIEAYVSQKRNAYSDQQALAALRLIGPNLKTAYHDGSNEKAREKMMLGATLAGIAFSNSSVALVHGMSRPIGAFFHVPHGLSNAMLLPSVTEFSIPLAADRYAECAVAMGVATEEDGIAKANIKLIQFLKELNAELQVPTLMEFGADKAEFDRVVTTMVEQAFASGSPNNNPRIPTKEEMLKIYNDLW